MRLQLRARAREHTDTDTDTHLDGYSQELESAHEVPEISY